MITWILVALAVSSVLSGMWAGFADFVRQSVINVMEKLKSFLHKVFVGTQCLIKKVGGVIYKVAKHILFDEKGKKPQAITELEPLSDEEVSNLDENMQMKIKQLKEGQSVDVTKEVKLELKGSV